MFVSFKVRGQGKWGWVGMSHHTSVYDTDACKLQMLGTLLNVLVTKAIFQLHPQNLAWFLINTWQSFRTPHQVSPMPGD